MPSIPPYVDENPDYWQDYSNLQRVKHALLRRYLGGWFPILASWRGRVIYIDCHSGRGIYAGGQMGSPLVALDTLTKHRYLPMILRTAEVNFLFVERDPGNKTELEAHLKKHPLPSRVSVETVCEDYERVIQGIVDHLKSNNLQMAPAFVFVDPYGFKLSMRLLAQVKAFERCELFVTFMWRYIDMALNNPSQEENMDALFGCSDWRSLRSIEQASERCEAAIQLFQKGLGARFVTSVKMLGENRGIKYVLLHATNHQRGRELMKEAIWSVAPEGGFVVRQSDNPQQEFLIEPTPNLALLFDWLWRKYRGHRVKYNEIENELLETVFLPKHLHQAIRTLYDSAQVECSGFRGRFSFAQNPIVDFARSEEEKLGKR